MTHQMGLEPTTFCSEDRCSTIEPLVLAEIQDLPSNHKQPNWDSSLDLELNRYHYHSNPLWYWYTTVISSYDKQVYNCEPRLLQQHSRLQKIPSRQRQGSNLHGQSQRDFKPHAHALTTQPRCHGCTHQIRAIFNHLDWQWACSHFYLSRDVIYSDIVPRGCDAAITKSDNDHSSAFDKWIIQAP